MLPSGVALCIRMGMMRMVLAGAGYLLKKDLEPPGP
jgi:hypothetical protein